VSFGALNLFIILFRELMMSASSEIIEDVDAMRKQGLASLVFFYHDFREDQKTAYVGSSHLCYSSFAGNPTPTLISFPVSI
jgi:hypothetical protein